MVKLQYLSDNLIHVINELFNNQVLCRYLYYNDKHPLNEEFFADDDVTIIDVDKTKPDIEGITLFMNNIFPVPFDPKAISTDACELRVYYSRGNINDVVVEDLKLLFDIVVPKNLWFVHDKEHNPKVRPYEIMQEIVKTFCGKSIQTVGKLSFGDWRHLYVNETYDAIQLSASIVQFSKG